MRKFNFRLQALHDTVAQRERGVRHDLVRAEGIEDRLRDQIEALLSSAAEWEARIRENQQGAHDVALLKSQLAALGMVQQQIARQRALLREAEKATDRVRQQLTEAARKRKALDRLRDRLEADHDEEAAAHRARQSDDMAALRTAAVRLAGSEAEGSGRSNDTVITGVSR